MFCLPCVPWHLCRVSVAREDQRGHTSSLCFFFPPPLLEYHLYVRIGFGNYSSFISDNAAYTLGAWKREEDKQKNYSLQLCQRLPICLKGQEVYEELLRMVDRHFQKAAQCHHAKGSLSCLFCT